MTSTSASSSGTDVHEPTSVPVALREIAQDRADWLVDAVATATQNRALLRGEPEADDILIEALLLNAEKAILVAFKKAGIMQGREPDAAGGGQ